MKPSSKKVLAAKVRRPAASAGAQEFADRAVECMVAGFNKAQRTGKFPKVY